MADTNLGTAYFTLLPSMTGTASKITKELSGSAVTAAGKRAGMGIGSVVLSGIGSKISAGAIAVGGLLESALVSAVSGIGNVVADAIDLSDAVKKFEGTMTFAGFDQASIDLARSQIEEYAASTVYDLGEVANTAAQLAANGIEDFVGLTQAVGNLNAAAGGNADTFSSVALMLTQTAAAGKLTTENWNQLADAIPGASGVIQQALLEAGAYTGNFRDALEAGEISAEEFSAALMSLGWTEAAQAAATSTKTMEGAVGNAQAAIVGGMREIYDAVNGEGRITGAVSAIGDAFGGLLTSVAPTIGAFAAEVERLMAMDSGVYITSFLTTSLTGGLSSAFAAITAAIPEVMQRGVEVAHGLAQGIVLGAPELLTSFGSLVSDGGSAFVAGAGDIVTMFAGRLSTGLPEITAAAADMLSGIVDAVPGVLDSLLAALANLVAMAAYSLPTLSASLIDGAVTLFQSISSAVPQVLAGVTEALGLLVSNVASSLPGFASVLSTEAPKLFQGIVDAVPGLLSSLGTSLTALVSDFSALIPAVAETVATAAPQLFQGIADALPELLTSLATGLAQLAVDFSATIPTVATTIATAAPQLFASIVEAVPGLLTSLTTGLATLATDLVAQFPTVAVNIATGAAALFVGIAEALPTILPDLISAVVTLLVDLATQFPTMAVNLATAAGSLFQGIVDAIPEIWTGMQAAFSTLLADLGEDMPTHIESLKTAAADMFSSITGALMEIPLIAELATLVQGVIDDFPNWVESLKTAAGDLWENIKTAVGEKVEGLKTAAGDLIQGAIDKIKEFDMLQVGIDMIQGFIDGIASMAQNIINSVTGVFSGAVEAAKNFLGIASPSKLFFEFGGFVDEGFANGVLAYADLATDAMESLSRDAVDAFDPTLSVSGTFGPSGGLSAGDTYNLYIDGEALRADRSTIELLEAFVGSLRQSNGIGRAVYA